MQGVEVDISARNESLLELSALLLIMAARRVCSAPDRLLVITCTGLSRSLSQSSCGHTQS